jgi:[acyl-carrier-protein] S-malonyltransferase
MELDPRRTAFLFPGQGSQAVGMGRALAEAEPVAAAVFEEADQVLGIPLTRLCWEGPADLLNETINTQPALLTHSVAALKAVQARLPGFVPAFVAGHSLGEFSALVAAGALRFADALRLVRERGRAMKTAGEHKPGGMAAVLGLEREAIEAVCRDVSSGPGGVVQVANDNCPGQVVISGDEGALAAASEQLSRRGAKKVVRLAVSIAAHSPLMAPAQDDFNRALMTAEIDDPRVPVVGNVSAAPLTTAQDVRADLSAQLTAKVRWTESIRAMAAAGVKTFLEMGPGTVLIGLLRRIEPSAVGLAIGDPASIQALLA